MIIGVEMTVSLSQQMNLTEVAALYEQVQADLPEPTHSLVITEKRATVQASVNRGLPSMAALNKQGLYLAGDYCHPRYPATLEGAVQSGFATASMCVADWKNA